MRYSLRLPGWWPFFEVYISPAQCWPTYWKVWRHQKTPTGRCVSVDAVRTLSTRIDVTFRCIP